MSIELPTIPAPQRWFVRTSQRLPRHRSDVRETELDHEIVLSDPRSSRSYRFNKTAFSVWCLCDGITPVDRIGRTISKLYDTDYATALDHVDQLLTVFAEMGLLEPETIL